MEQRSAGRPAGPSAMILKAGVLNAVLVTVVSAAMIALVSGTGTDDPNAPFSMSPARTLWCYFPNPWELAKATVLLCPITAVWYGAYGLLVGAVGSALMYWRRRHIGSTRRLLLESAVAGFLLAGLFPLLDSWFDWPRGLICMGLGVPCALLCAFAFRRRFKAFGYYRPPAGLA